MSPGHIPANLLRFVRRRAGDLCEYCRLPQSSQEATFHVDHIKPRTAGGTTTPNNLALACVTCSLRKAARQKVRDARTAKVVPLFDPRADQWIDHFAWTRSCRVRGKTPTGRATATALGMNRPAIIVIRQQLAAMGRFPPEEATSGD
jgi:5-methylcytosine-specific restriction endonuclease McrA